MRNLLLLVLCLLAPVASANEAAIRKALGPVLGGTKIDSVQPAAIPGLFEVRLSGRDGPQLLYSDPQGNFILDGNLFEAKSGRNLTEDRLRKLTAISFSSLPLELAVKVQRGNGKRVVAIFSDPYCPACKQFEKSLAQVDDITIYYYMYPVIRPELAEHSKAVWCAPDRARAWIDLALHGKPITAKAKCDVPMEKMLELGKSLRVNSTPTLILATGERLRGGLPPDQMRSVLDDAMKEAAASAKAK
jgi:thiol:disulfide interchange protein DsbC